MTVYIVMWSVDYEDSGIDSIWTSRTKAYIRLDEFKNEHNEHYDEKWIDEWEVSK